MRTNASQKKPVLSDWHPADVMAALHKAGWSFRQLALHHGYTGLNVLSGALRRPYPRAESLIADALGIAPQDIWPSRYTVDGKSNRQPGRQPMRPVPVPVHANRRSASLPPSTQK